MLISYCLISYLFLLVQIPVALLLVNAEYQRTHAKLEMSSVALALDVDRSGEFRWEVEVLGVWAQAWIGLGRVVACHADGFVVKARAVGWNRAAQLQWHAEAVWTARVRLAHVSDLACWSGEAWWASALELTSG